MQKLLSAIYSFYKKFDRFMIGFIRRHKIITGLTILGLAATLFLMLRPDSSIASSEKYTVKAGTIEEAVSLTGRVKPTEEASVTFEKSGTIRSVNVEIGTKVKKGDILATLSGDDAYARVAEASAALSAQRSILADLNSVAKEEQINIKKLSVEKAVSDLEQAYRNIDDSVRNLSIVGNDVVRNNFATIYSGGYNEGYRLNIASCNSQLEINTNNSRKTAEDALRSIENISNTYNIATTQDEKNALIVKMRNDAQSITAHLTNMRDLFASECIINNTSLTSTRISVGTSRSAWSSALIDISTKQSAINSLMITKKQAEEDLKLLLSGEKSAKISQQEANVRAAEARVSQAQSEANRNILKSPFTGVVTGVDLKPGEYAVMGGSKNISLISDSEFEIEAKVSEVDIAKVKKDDTAKVTFDTYGDDVKFGAIITNISPSGVITDGVPTYKTIFSFSEKDERIKGGMTASIYVTTNKIENVLAVPTRSIKNTNGVKTVKVLRGSKTEDVTITTGARGIDGEIEIKTGLNAGDVILIEKTN